MPESSSPTGRVAMADGLAASPEHAKGQGDELAEWRELSAAVVQAEHPILPKPEWSQDVAFVAFIIDKLHDQTLGGQGDELVAARKVVEAARAVLTPTELSSRGNTAREYNYASLARSIAEYDLVGGQTDGGAE